MSEISGELNSRTRNSRPRLKSGISFWRSTTSRQLHIGSRLAHFLIPDQIGSIEVESTLRSIARGESSSGGDFQLILSILESLSLIDSQVTEIDYQYGDDERNNIAALKHRSVAEERFLERIEIEAAGVSRNSKVKDGGVRKVLERREFSIEIHGTGRIAYALLGLLISSGFETCQITDSKVASLDLMGGSIMQADIGKSSGIKRQELRKEFSLYPEPSEIFIEPALVISIGQPSLEEVNQWNRLGVPQLFVDFDCSGEVRIGPYVTPGSGACYNCVSIAEVELGLPALDLLKRLSDNDKNSPASTEVSAALATFSAGALAMAVIQIADNGYSDFHQKSALYSMHNFFEPQITSWERSPRCGCNWI
ncbi:MAG: hypothetical protein RLZZ12_845 [Actinomycetota bacterium]|jgi:hypothetical protein